jgi:hypothetical protein
MTRRLTGFVCVLLALTAAPVRAQDGAPTRPVGRWEHKLPKGNGVTLVLEDNRLHLSMKSDTRLVLHADYALTRDGVLYGVVTSAEAPDGPDTDEQDLMDEPFSIVYRVDEGSLVIRDVRSGTLTKEEVALIVGRYEKNSPPPSTEALQKTAQTTSRRNRDRIPATPALPSLAEAPLPGARTNLPLPYSQPLLPIVPPMMKEPTSSFYPH